MKATAALDLVKAAIVNWNEDRVPQHAAALSYYTIFSIAPLLIIIIALVGMVFGRQAIESQIVAQVRNLIGQDGAAMVQSMVENASKPASGIVASVLGLIALLGGSLGVFGQLKASLNSIWHVPARRSKGFIRDAINVLRQQLVSFAMILVIGFLLLVSLVLSAILSALTSYFGERLGESVALAASAWEVVNFVLSLTISALLFAAIYKILPDVRIRWKDVGIGATITAFLFTVGKSLIGLYLGRSSITSTYGAAGALVILLVWVNYSAQIFFLGAELTQVYTRQYGSRAAGTKPENQDVRQGH